MLQIADSGISMLGLECFPKQGQLCRGLNFVGIVFAQPGDRANVIQRQTQLLVTAVVEVLENQSAPFLFFGREAGRWCSRAGGFGFDAGISVDELGREAAVELLEAYQFLRRLENFIQAMRDQLNGE